MRTTLQLVALAACLLFTDISTAQRRRGSGDGGRDRGGDGSRQRDGQDGGGGGGDGASGPAPAPAPAPSTGGGGGGGDGGQDRRPTADDINRELDGLQREARGNVNTRRQQRQQAADRGNRRYDDDVHSPFERVARVLKTEPYAAGLTGSVEEMLETLRLIQDRHDLSKEDMERLIPDLRSTLSQDRPRGTPDQLPPIPDASTCPYPDIDCDDRTRFRTIDGSCNNLRNPNWGKAFYPLKRLLRPDYADGIAAPRTSSTPGRALPSARAVSLGLFSDLNQTSHTHTLMLMTFGQYLDHDLTLTALSTLVDRDNNVVAITCGDSGCETDQPEYSECLPIPADPDQDPGPCLQFVRSQAATNERCAVGPREQLNQISGFIDGSNVYGSDSTTTQALRDSDSDRGKLQTKPNPFHSTAKPLLPPGEDPECREETEKVKCFHAGDIRANEHAGLASVHTITHRAHNHYEALLHALDNPGWDGERLFQEARRIVGAALQIITYNEFLPLVLGEEYMEKYDLNLLKDGFQTGYRPDVDATISNAFATAAYRFGHSLVDNFMRFAERDYDTFEDMELTRLFFNPTKLYEPHGMDKVVLGQISKQAQNRDAHFAGQIQGSLFTEHPPAGHGHDLPALNIQRGRDHGLPGYNAWRRHCRLNPARSFSDLDDIPQANRQHFADIYSSPDDIDLFAGGIAERSMPGALVGPTFGCIIADQFKRSKYGDRFWHENENERGSFTPAQLRELRKLTFARLLCDNLDSVTTIQKYVLMQPKEHAEDLAAPVGLSQAIRAMYERMDKDNVKVPCRDIPDIDIRAWRANNN